MRIVLLGGPGAGKGTLAKYLKEEFGFDSLSPGELYRKEANEGTEFGLRARDEYWGAGNLCPDEMTNELVKRTIAKTSNPRLIFDGYPRTKVQAEYLDFVTDVDLVIDIKVDDDVAVKRLLNRATIENRPDDTAEVIEQRIKVYHSNVSDILGYYAGDDRYFAIDGSGTPLDTFLLAQQIIGEMI